MSKITDQTVTGPQLGEILNLTSRRIRQYAEEGIFPRVGRGRYPLAVCVQAYCAQLEARGDSGDLRRERIALVKAQTRRIEIDNQRKEGTEREMDAQDACVRAFATELFLRLRPVSNWLHSELVNRGHADAREVAGTVAGWLVGARAEIEDAVLRALAASRRRGVLVTDHDELVRLMGGHGQRKGHAEDAEISP